MMLAASKKLSLDSPLILDIAYTSQTVFMLFYHIARKYQSIFSALYPRRSSVFSSSEVMMRAQMRAMSARFARCTPSVTDEVQSESTTTS